MRFAARPGGCTRPAALDGVDDDAAALGFGQRGRVPDVVRVIHVRRCIADQEYDLIDIVVLAPRDLVDRIVERLVDAFGPVAAALGAKIHQAGVHLIEIFGQIEDAGDVGVAAIAKRDQSHLDVGILLRRGHGRCDRPDLFPGRLNQAAHAAGGIQHEHDLDAVFPVLRVEVTGRCLDGLRLLQRRESRDAGRGGDTQAGGDQFCLEGVDIHVVVSESGLTEFAHGVDSDAMRGLKSGAVAFAVRVVSATALRQFGQPAEQRLHQQKAPQRRDQAAGVEHRPGADGKAH